MAIKNEFFETENNKKAQAQNAMDNSGGIRYNKLRKPCVASLCNFVAYLKQGN